MTSKELEGLSTKLFREAMVSHFEEGSGER